MKTFKNIVAGRRDDYKIGCCLFIRLCLLIRLWLCKMIAVDKQINNKH